jgi:hypothetical protein
LLVNCSRSREAVDRRLEGDVKASVDTAHGNLTALSFGVPHIVINNPLRAAKVEGYVRLAGLDEFRITDWAALEETFDRLGATPRERWATTADRLKARVCEQFDRLTELIARAAEERRETRDRPAKSRGELPLELYSTIASCTRGWNTRRPPGRPRRRSSVTRRSSSGTGTWPTKPG